MCLVKISIRRPVSNSQRQDSLPIFHPLRQRNSQLSLAPKPVSTPTVEQVIEECIPHMLRIRILDQYGSHSKDECKEFLKYASKNEEKIGTPSALGQIRQWQEFYNKTERELRYSRDSEELPPDWRHETPNITIIDDVCEKKGWDRSSVLEVLRTHAYPEMPCFKSHTSDGQPKRTHVTRLQEVIERCEWTDLASIIDRDLDLLETVFPASDKEGQLLKSIVMAVEETYFQRRGKKDGEAIDLSRYAVRLTERMLKNEKVNGRLETMGEMSYLRRKLTMLFLEITVS